jgi:glycosyltransferase involved in cell wall biosynthesis
MERAAQVSVKFSVITLTYNRPQLLQFTARSVLEQDYQNFEYIVVDNGSTTPLDRSRAPFDDPRVRVIRYDVNTHGCDVCEAVLDQITGTHVLFVADDDVLVPGMLARVADLLEHRPEIEALGVGLLHYEHGAERWQSELDDVTAFTGELQRFPGEQTAVAFCNGWGIGRRLSFPIPRMGHSSAAVHAKALFDRTRRKQGVVFVKPFGDIGFVGLLANTDFGYYWDLPLAVIGATPVREMVGVQRGERLKWRRELPSLEHTPLRAPSFWNVGMDGHLKVMFLNGLQDRWDVRLRPDFFERHMRQVASDSPWTTETIRDLAEALPLWATSKVQFAEPLSLVRSLYGRAHEAAYRIAKRALGQEARPAGSPPAIPPATDGNRRYRDILEFAEWSGRRFTNTAVMSASA